MMIKSCPNCGSVDVLDYKDWETGSPFISCCDCNFGKNESMDTTYTGAVKKWNAIKKTKNPKIV